MDNLSIVTGSFATLQLPSLALRQRSVDVPQDVSPSQLRQLIEEMFVILYQKRGVGLAAPQVGVLWRIFVVDLQLRDPAQPPLVVINPSFTEVADEIELGTEGCLSIPGYHADTVPRAPMVRLEGFDQHLEPIRIDARGYLARVFQHEYDHLDGRLYIDLLASMDELIPDAPEVRARQTTEHLFSPRTEPQVVPPM
jgi:peptide deformylase